MSRSSRKYRGIAASSGLPEGSIPSRNALASVASVYAGRTRSGSGDDSGRLGLRRSGFLGNLKRGSYSLGPLIGRATIAPSTDPIPLRRWQPSQRKIVPSVGVSPFTETRMGFPEGRTPSRYILCPRRKSSARGGRGSPCGAGPAKARTSRGTRAFSVLSPSGAGGGGTTWDRLGPAQAAVLRQKVRCADQTVDPHP